MNTLRTKQFYLFFFLISFSHLFLVYDRKHKEIYGINSLKFIINIFLSVY